MSLPDGTYQDGDDLLTPTPDGFRCARVTGETTREELIARGITPEAADELIRFREMLSKRRRHPHSHPLTRGQPPGRRRNERRTRVDSGLRCVAAVRRSQDVLHREVVVSAERERALADLESVASTLSKQRHPAGATIHLALAALRSSEPPGERIEGFVDVRRDSTGMWLFATDRDEHTPIPATLIVTLPESAEK